MNSPLTRTERKILVYNKCKEGLTYEEAYKEVEKELAYLDKMSKDKRVNGRLKSQSQSDLFFKEKFGELK